MRRSYDTEQYFHPDISHAAEHSVAFTDLRANTDTRHLRLWLNNEVHDELWLPIDIARGGLSVVNTLSSAERNFTPRNEELLRRVATSAYTLYQRDKLTDEDGNLIAFVLPRNAYLQLGFMPKGHFDALRGGSLAPNHVALQVDDNDILGIEANHLDNPPQIEVLSSDGDTAVEIGSSMRNYVTPADIGSGYVTRSEQPFYLSALSGHHSFVSPRSATVFQRKEAAGNSQYS